MRRLTCWVLIAASGGGGLTMAETSHICWIERVEAVGADAVRVRLQAAYRGTLKRIVRQDGAEERPAGSPPPHFDLRAGDAAHLLTAHDTCVLAGVRLDGRLGVQASALNRVHGLPPVEASAFIAPSGTPSPD